ncbi:protein serine/threonine phosphatase 2C [Dentipellis sp. KUC8613]|nr:protein serine/threonine phosphatase 2C [Dentipellis sp. KUC8613]
MTIRLPKLPHASFVLTATVSPRNSHAARTCVRFASNMPRPYRFHIGASWQAKPPDPPSKRHTMANTTQPFPPDSPIGKWREKTLSRPKAGSSKSAGEDFFYIEDMRNQSGVSFGVADGVGGWVESGVDPSLFSQALMYHAHRYAKNAWPGEPEIDPTQDYEDREEVEGWELSPGECLALAHDGVMRERAVLAGSSTACIINLNASNGVLRAANLGDSGFMIIRSSAVFYRQPSQTHFFNCPLQLAKLPSHVDHEDMAVDMPSDADLYETKLRDGDIVIAYTDGLSDNVFNNEILSLCSLVSRAGGPEDMQVQTMADRTVEYARACMSSKVRVTPFEKAAAREGLFYRGGKMDDVTVVVALVREVL